MKKLILLTVVLVFAAVKPAHAQFVVVSWCSPNLGDPTFCFDVVGPVFSGTANVFMGAICDNGNQPSVDAGVSAVGCFLPVVLSADVRILRFIDTDDLRAEAQAQNIFGVYWAMFDENACNGFRDRFVQPPAPC